jgi:hypothetical protein
VFEGCGVVAFAGCWLLGWLWVRIDAHRRLAGTFAGSAATLMAALPIAGPVLYLLIRPPETVLQRRSRTSIRQLLERLLDESALPQPPE